MQYITFEARRGKKYLKIFVVVIPKEGLAGWGPTNPPFGMTPTIGYILWRLQIVANLTPIFLTDCAMAMVLTWHGIRHICILDIWFIEIYIKLSERLNAFLFTPLESMRKISLILSLSVSVLFQAINQLWQVDVAYSLAVLPSSSWAWSISQNITQNSWLR